MRKYGNYLHLLLILLLPSLTLAQDKTRAELLGIRLQLSPSSSQIIFVLNKKPEYRVQYLSDPRRVVVELLQTDNNFKIQYTRLVGANMTSMRSETSAGHNVRFIFTVDQEVTAKVRILPSKMIQQVQMQIDVTSSVGSGTMKR